MKKCLMIATAVAGSVLFAGDTITAATTFGAMCVDSTNATTVISVPWANANGEGVVKLSDLIVTDKLAANDKLYMYEEGTWYLYKLKNDGSWEPATTATPVEAVEGTSANAKPLPRGTAMVLERSGDKTKSIILMGKYDTTAGTAVASPVSVPAGASALIGNPTTVTNYIPNSVGSNGDVIQEIKDGGASKLYVYDTDHWTEEVSVTRSINGVERTGKTYTVLSTGVPIAPGCGVRYISSSKAASVTLN